MWTLVITVILYGFDYRSVGSPSIGSVSGFETEQACINASKKVLDNSMPDGNYQKVVTKAICVSKNS